MSDFSKVRTHVDHKQARLTTVHCLIFQLMLREFEDKENLLAEMEGQVDTYREEGKEEAASRLEDQLTLIHTKFQVVSGKFELFQRPSDFDGRLGRVSRQLVDLQSNIYLTDIISHETETIEVRS